MKNKILKLSLFILPLTIFLIATFIYFSNKKTIEKIVIDDSTYVNISNFNKFKEEIQNELNINFSELFIKNGCQIEVDSLGNVLNLNLDLFYIKENKIFSIQIEKNENSYLIIKQEIYQSNITGKELSYYLNMISYWENLNLNENYIITFQNETITDINKSLSIERYLLNECEVLLVDSNNEGYFIKVTFLLFDNSFKELYFQVK